ncbi:MAG: hypothetical protein AAF636_13610 [Pseudomonadota bacterium]
MPGHALSEADLEARGYREMSCLFDQRCVIGQPCERAWRDQRWYLNDAEAAAYRVYRGGQVSRRAQLMQDQRWKNYSEARAILMPMREAVASHLTAFDGGGAIYSLQYAGNPGAGQFFLRQCDLPEEAE